MTNREQRLVVVTLGCVEVAASVIFVIDWLVTGERSTALMALFFVVVLASGPFVIAGWKHDLEDHKLPISHREPHPRNSRHRP